MWFGHDIEVSNASSGVRHSVVQGRDRPGLAAKSKLCRMRGNMRKPFYSEDQVAQIDSRLQPLVFSGQSRESLAVRDVGGAWAHLIVNWCVTVPEGRNSVSRDPFLELRFNAICIVVEYGSTYFRCVYSA